MDSLLLIVLAVALLVAVAMFAGISAGNRRRSGLDQEYFRRHWQQIETHKQGGGAGWQVAIFEADKLLDHALKGRGMPGDTMGERLKAARGVFRNNNDIWFAHKLRNRLAHETNVQLNVMGVDKALRGFKNGLKDLGAL